MVATNKLLLLGSLLAVASAKPMVRRGDSTSTSASTAATATESATASETTVDAPAGAGETTPSKSDDKPTEKTDTKTDKASDSASATSSAKDVKPTTEFARPWTNKWVLEDKYEGDKFFTEFDYETMDDPTNGRVNYVDAETAKARGLAWTDENRFGMGADSWSIVKPDARGRDSVRIKTKKEWVDHLVIFDFLHMPWGCGTWPAFWTLGEAKEWPAAGEIDIIEGTNEDTTNLMSVHTGRGENCYVPPANRSAVPEWAFEGAKAAQTLCDGDQGCNARVDAQTSFGKGLNAEGGGYYIMRRDVRGVSFWHWPRTSGAVPESILEDSDQLDETSLGTKIADFPATSLCEKMDELLLAQKLIINLTFCGGWGTDIWKNGGCAKKFPEGCPAYVDNNPAAFEEAFWLINSLRVYTPAK